MRIVLPICCSFLLLPIGPAVGGRPTEEDNKKTEELLNQLDKMPKNLEGKTLVLYGADLSTSNIEASLAPIKGTKLHGWNITFGADRRYWTTSSDELTEGRVNFLGSQDLASQFKSFVRKKMKSGRY